MNFEEVLQARKSIRSYIDKPVEEEKLHAILDAANLAPSWKNSQTARCYVTRGGDTAQGARGASCVQSAKYGTCACSYRNDIC